MPRSVSSTCRSLRLFIVVVAVALGAELAATAHAQATHGQDGEILFVRPTRRASDTAPAGPAELPPRADEIQPLTFEVVTQWTPRTGPASTERQRVSRTSDRIHLVTARTEWLFERNPVDPRRVSALLVHHASRTIVAHEESDLRHMARINGWATVLMLGLDATALRSLTPTKESRTHAGLQFQKHISASDRLGLSEVWWNQDHLLPLTIVIREAAGRTNVTVQRLKHGADPALLRSPSTRFPEYRLIDLAEWLEGRD